MHFKSKFRMTQLVVLIASIASLVTSLIFFFLYFHLYWPYRALFNSEGTYFDTQANAVYHEDSGILLLPAFLLLIITLALCKIWHYRRSAQTPKYVD